MMKNDWAFHIALLAGVCVMVVSALTYDHDRADRREQLMGMRDRFEEGGHFAFAPWRSAREVVLRAKDVEREARWWAEQIKGDTGLDVAALEGITLYWCALGELNGGQDENVALQGVYGDLLASSIERFEASASGESGDAIVRFLYGYYKGRAYARSMDPPRSREALALAVKNVGALPGDARPFDAFMLVRTLSDSLRRAEDPEPMREMFATQIRLYIEETVGRFDTASLRAQLLNPHDGAYREEVLRLALSMMEAWLEREGESFDRGRSWIDIGWHHRSLGDSASAASAWRNAELAWESRSSAKPTASNLYMHARTLALIGEREAALDRLESSLDAGYDRVRRISAENDLASIREDDRFAALAERARELFDARYEEIDEQ